MDVYRANWPQYHNCSHRGLGAVTIQYNHEWTRINTNENRRCDAFLPTQSSSPNRDCKAGHPKSLNRRAIRVYSCLPQGGMVSHCMDTAKLLKLGFEADSSFAGRSIRQSSGGQAPRTYR